MQKPLRFGRRVVELVIVLVATVSLAGSGATADTPTAPALLTGRVTHWGGLLADGDFRPPTFVVTDTRSQRAFFLSRTNKASPLLTVMDIDEASGSYENLAAIRWLAGHASSDGAQLRNEAEEAAAEQLAVWMLAGAEFDLSAVHDPAIRSRAERLVSKSSAAAATWTPPQYAKSYEVSADNRDEHTNTLRFTPRITSQPTVPLTNALFTVEAKNSQEDQFSVTANRTGVGPIIGLRESTSVQENLLRADILLDPGIIFSGPSGTLVTAQTIPISRSTPVSVPAASLKRITAVFDASLASNLTPAGKRVYWSALAAGAVLATVALVRIGAKLAELFEVKASADPDALRMRRKIFYSACGLALMGLAPFSYFFIKEEFVAYGYTRPVDPQPELPTRQLRPVQEWASNCFQPDGLTYFPANLTDEDYASAWVSARERGAGSLIAFDFGQVVTINRLSIWNGVQSYKDRFYSNGRVTTLQVLSDGGWVQVASLNPDEQNEQVVDSDQGMSPIVTRYLVLRVGGLNDTYLNAALTEVKFYGHLLSNVARPAGISVDPAGLDLTKQAHTNPRNAACHPG